jgi:hypothetical protein
MGRGGTLAAHRLYFRRDFVRILPGYSCGTERQRN